MPLHGSNWFRIYLIIFASVLGLLASWILIADLIQPPLPCFPQNQAGEQEAVAARWRAVAAASVGWLRGDLWTEAAITLASARQIPGYVVEARSAAQRAARFSPEDSRIWLVLAALVPQSETRADKIADLLKMSYYTGPNEIELSAVRIKITVRSPAIADAELQNLAAQEIQKILLRHEDKKPAIWAAYQTASPQGKQFIEAVLRNIDKGLLARIRGSVDQKQ